MLHNLLVLLTVTATLHVALYLFMDILVIPHYMKYLTINYCTVLSLLLLNIVSVVYCLTIGSGTVASILANSSEYRFVFSVINTCSKLTCHALSVP